ncbi:MAG TPA: SPFH domain-containing protein, partial [Gemmataceae bacterium]|nr:SPFH domain-containing protein [Gemmataceae bacterium]
QLTVDSIGIVTVHDGPSLAPGQIIAPEVGTQRNDPNYHNNYQDTEAFLRAGGLRGRQYAVLTDGTYFINRWFATIEMHPKTIVPIGYVGVVVSYYGRVGEDVSGEAFRHGERVVRGQRGVWEEPLGPDKYAFNPYAGKIILVPTTNFVLHWITGKSETHRYDDTLKSIDLVTRDAYEPSLPLSVVVHIDYRKAPGVIQRFGDVKKLITQTLDPMLSAFFRDVAHKKTMLELLHDRDVIQDEARAELRRKFLAFDMECVDVLIGKPVTEQAGGKIETLLEQLRLRQLSIEQIQTFEHQRQAAAKQQELNEAQAKAAKQTELTSSHMQVQVIENQAQAELARARKQAEQTVVTAQAENQKRILQAEADLVRARKQAEQTVVLAEAESRQRELAGRGEAARVMQIGLSEASVQLRKISAFGDPRLYALAQVAEHLSHSEQPLVPERVFVAGGAGENGHANGLGQGVVGTLIGLLVAEKSGFQMTETADLASLKEFAERMTSQVLASMQNGGEKKPAVVGDQVEKAAKVEG